MSESGERQAVRESPPPLARGQRRYLTIVFSDVSGSTALASAMEAEDYADLLGDLRAIYEAVVPRHGGEIVRIDGDGVAMIFGHPEAHEDDGRRAAEAAIDLHAAARRLTAPGPGVGGAVRLHTGIHSGLVLVDKGDLVRGRFEMLGDATNVAKRLADLAAPDEILVSEETLGAERHFFRTGERLLVTPRGKDTALAVVSILGREATQTRFATRVRRGLAPFAGRAAELRQMEVWLEEASAGANRLGVIVGQAGLGKTRLAVEFLAQAARRGLPVHRGYCESYLGARPLQPFLQLLRSVFEIDPSAVGEAAAEQVGRSLERLAPDLIGRQGAVLRLLSLRGGEAAERGAPTSAESAALLRDLFDRIARNGPFILFIDDWQWADDISRQALNQIRAITGGGLLVLLATREYAALEARLTEARVIELSPLGRAESEAAIGAMLPASEPFTVGRIADYSGGNPLFIEELCHAASQGAGDRTPEQRSGWLDAMVESRFSRLPADQADLVRAASVIGNMIPAWLFEEITGVGENGPMIDALEKQDFIYQSDTPGMLRFKHALTRDAVYQKVGLHERRGLHRRVAQALRRHVAPGGEDEPFEALAYHYSAGGDPALAAYYAEQAGDKAMSVSSLDRAQAQYRAALTALETVEASDSTVDRWNAIVRKYGLASVVDPSRSQLPIFQRAAAAAAVRGDMGALAWSEFWLGYIYYGLGQARNSIAHCRRALKAATEFGDDRLIVQVRATLGQALATAGEYEPALVLLDEAIEIKARNFKGVRPSIGLAYSLSCKGFVLADQGGFDAAYALFDRAIEVLCGEEHEMAASVISQRSAACLWQGRLDLAADYAAESQSIAGRVKARYLFSMSQALGAYAQWSTDRCPAALRTLAEATSWLEASQSQQFLSLNHGWLAEAMSETGDWVQTRRHAARALRRARQGDRLGEAMALRALARAADRSAMGRPASHYLALAERSASARKSAHETIRNRICAVDLKRAAGDVPGAAAALKALVPDAMALGMTGILRLRGEGPVPAERPSPADAAVRAVNRSDPQASIS